MTEEKDELLSLEEAVRICNTGSRTVQANFGGYWYIIHNDTKFTFGELAMKKFRLLPLNQEIWKIQEALDLVKLTPTNKNKLEVIINQLKDILEQLERSQ